jgi:hypothetical protein
MKVRKAKKRIQRTTRTFVHSRVESIPYISPLLPALFRVTSHALELSSNTDVQNFLLMSDIFSQPKKPTNKKYDNNGDYNSNKNNSNINIFVEYLQLLTMKMLLTELYLMIHLSTSLPR